MTVATCLAVLGYRFSRLPGWRDQRWFWILAASAALYAGCNAVVTLDVPEWVIHVGAHLNWLALTINILAWTLHSAAHFHRSLSPIERAFVGLAVLIGGAALLPSVLLEQRLVTHHFMHVPFREPPTTLLGTLATIPLFVAAIVPLWRFLKASKDSPDARRYAVGLLLLMGASLNDIAVATGRFNLPYLLDLALLPMIVLAWRVLMDRFIANTHRLDMLSTQLEGIVTERTRELAKAHEALMQAERLAAVGRLSAGVAHEINNPSTAVVSNLNYLKSSLEAGELPSDARDALDDSLVSMGNITRIVRQLLDTGRVAAADSSMRSTFNVASAVQRAAQTARLALELPFELSADVPAVFAVGDQLMVEQVLVNLVVNGVQAVPPGREPRIKISVESVTGTVKVRVTDNGSGMSEEVARRAFEPFFSTKPFGKGTGLGLSVSLGLAKAMGGDLRIAASSPSGTAMELWIRSSLRLSSIPAPAAEGPAGALQRLLIVDDDPIVRESLSRMLSKVFVVETATGVSDARKRVSAAHFDAILCDVMMDEGGGEALFAWLERERPSYASRVIFVTGGVTNDAARRFLDGQSQPVLYKPVDLLTIEHAVDEVSVGRV
jgi:signal transduction histidine kinase